jgi:hypothetical protein
MSSPGDGSLPADASAPSDRPSKRTFSDLSAADQLRVVEILRPGWQRALARYQARKAGGTTPDEASANHSSP